MSDIKPALSAEEWGHRDDWSVEFVRGHTRLKVVNDWGSIVLFFEDETHGVQIAEEAHHALVAFLLHEQPFGFTLEDLVTLYEAIEAIFAAGLVVDRNDAERAATSELAREVENLGDRICALLPPSQE